MTREKAIRICKTFELAVEAEGIKHCTILLQDPENENIVNIFEFIKPGHKPSKVVRSHTDALKLLLQASYREEGF